MYMVHLISFTLNDTNTLYSENFLGIYTCNNNLYEYVNTAKTAQCLIRTCMYEHSGLVITSKEGTTIITLIDIYLYFRLIFCYCCIYQW